MRNRRITDEGPGNLLQPRCGTSCPGTTLATGIYLIMVKIVLLEMAHPLWHFKTLLAQVFTSDHGDNIWTLRMVEVWRRWGICQREQVWIDWELLVRSLHGSGAGYLVVINWVWVAAVPADPCATEQPYLGTALLTSTGEGPRKGGLKIAHSITYLDRLPRLSGYSTTAVEIRKIRNNTV